MFETLFEIVDDTKRSVGLDECTKFTELAPDSMNFVNFGPIGTRRATASTPAG
jgi:hypothetical protein